MAAKGGGAFGHFEVTNDASAYTKAAVFQPGTKTDTLIRFSTVAGERGSPDTWRDPRGFALKFYTSDGNYDMVGNNTPVFFLRDPLKFQHFIRSQKRRADNNLRDHDMQWDFWTLSPESAHQVTWLMGDRGIPRSWRHMNGYSSHTYMWINAAGARFWVKYHFKTDQGIEFLPQAEADQIAASDGDYHQRDLYQAIQRGEYPSWSLKMQIMPFEEARNYRFNPFDLTKVWPHSDYPKGGPQADSEHYKPVGWHADGDMVRAAYSLHAEDDDWGQAGTMVREVLDDAARERLVSNVVGHLLDGVTEPVLQRAFQYWRNVDKNLGDKIESGVRAKHG